MPKWGGAPTEKCTSCGKTVYPAEKNAMEGQVWHIECLRCTETNCNKKLGGANWGGFMPPENKPYCKIHFDRIIISSGKGGASSTTEWAPKESSGGGSSSSKFGARPTDKCEKCDKTVYPAEKLQMEGRIFHNGCLRCEECNKQLSGANFGGFTNEDKVYCSTHLKQIVRTAGGSTALTGPSEWKPKEDSDNKTPSKWGARPTDKCEICEKTVYPAEKNVLDGHIFHLGCIKCHECEKKLGGSNWGGFIPPENHAYCKIHFNRIIISSGKGGISSVTEWTPKESSSGGDDDSGKPKSRWGARPTDKCEKCGKTVYPAEMISMEGRIFHGPCLRCVSCSKALTGANWGAFIPPENQPYCKTHYMQLVKAKGDSTQFSGTGASGL